MKRLLFLILILTLLTSCRIPVKQTGVVTKVKKTTVFPNGDSDSYEFTVTTSNNIVFFTNDKFTVGDTIKVVKSEEIYVVGR